MVVICETPLNEIRTVINVDFRQCPVFASGNDSADFPRKIVADSGKAFNKIIGAEKGCPLASAWLDDVAPGVQFRIIPADNKDGFSVRKDDKTVAVEILQVDSKLFCEFDVSYDNRRISA